MLYFFRLRDWSIQEAWNRTRVYPSYKRRSKKIRNEWKWMEEWRPNSASGNFLTTMTETSRNSLKGSHFNPDHKKYNDLSIRPPYFKISGLDTPCQTWLFHKTLGHLFGHCFSAAVELSLSVWYWNTVIFWFWHW